MRARIALSFACFVALGACGGRTEVDDQGATVDHNQTLPNGSAGAGTSASGGSAAGKSGAPGSGGSNLAGAPQAAGGSGPGTGTTMGTGGSVFGGAGGLSSAGGAIGKGGTGAGGVGTGTGGSTTSTGGTGSGAFGGACNPVAQTSCKPGQKCSAETKGMGPSTSCVNNVGPVSEGGNCKRMGLGHDNCAAGLICTGVGVVDYDPMQQPPHRQCRKFCKADPDCGATQGCTQFTQDGFGVCVDSCIPFSACEPSPPTTTGSAGNNGGANVTCASVFQSNDGMNAFLGCHVVGGGKMDAPCQTNTDCAAGYFCGGGMGGMACQQLCNGTHTCDQKSAMCNAQQGELGVCQ